MVYCPKCGKKNDEDAEYCSKCATSLVGKQENAETTSLEKNVEDFAEEVGVLGKKAGKTIEKGVKNFGEEVVSIGKRIEKDLIEGPSSDTGSEEYKKLYRSGKNRYLGGVCAGVAEYFKMDPTIIRIIWTVLVFIPPGLGAILYILFWLFVPRNPNHSWV